MDYKLLQVIGEGTWGSVYLAVQRSTGRAVAVKQMKAVAGATGDGGGGDAEEEERRSRTGITFSALRELRVLREMDDCEHVMRVYDAYFSRSSGLGGGAGMKLMHVVMELLVTDLEVLLRDSSLSLSGGDAKSIMHMLLRGMAHVHGRFFLHRDLKPSNLLFNAQGVLKIADFGLARHFGSPNDALSPQAFTIWYKPPEVLFGDTHYTDTADMWGIGCIFAEIFLRRRGLFPGTSEVNQLGLIFRMLGTPTEENWPGARLLPNYMEFQHRSEGAFAQLRSVLGTLTDDGFDLFESMLRLDPTRRPSAEAALQHVYFSPEAEPAMSDPSALPLPVAAVAAGEAAAEAAAEAVGAVVAPSASSSSSSMSTSAVAAEAGAEAAAEAVRAVT